MDGHPRRNPAYRPATEKPRTVGAFLCPGNEVGSTEDRDLRIADDMVEIFVSIGLEERCRSR
jgi:hypothetical protein